VTQHILAGLAAAALVASLSGEVVAGNTRLKAAQSLWLTEVPVAWFEGSDLEATAYQIADNRTAEFAEWDDQSLAALLETPRAEDALEGVGSARPGIRGRAEGTPMAAAIREQQCAPEEHAPREPHSAPTVTGEDVPLAKLGVAGRVSKRLRRVRRAPTVKHLRCKRDRSCSPG
jgi:ParB-like chromosome segregation protein Spo0J